MNKLRYVYVVLAISLSNIAVAQHMDIRQYMEQVTASFNNYEARQQQAFEDYRNRLNAEFAEYMRQTWPEYETNPAEPIPDVPEPPAPIIKDPARQPSNDPLPFDDVKPAPQPVDPPQPVVPIPEHQPIHPDQPVQPDRPQFAFTFYGTPCSVSLTAAHRFKLSGVDESAVADAWLQLSSKKYTAVLSDCLAWRDKLQLPDWGYLRFVEKMTQGFFAANSQNEARLMQMYILVQSGYKVRIARAGNTLVLLLPSKENIYQYPYLSINNCRYYVMDKNARQNAYSVFDHDFPKEQYFSLQLSGSPLLPIQETTSRTFASQRFPAVSATITSNRNLIDFYNDYPQTDSWAVYVKSSLSEGVKKQLYPILQDAIDGKSKSESANILLNFVQTAFVYKTDEAQFGYERPLFADETLFYPYSDCEDRAILYSILVRELLGLEVALLHYPNHLATAICFDTEVSGDYMMIGGKRYIVCDPTYINADIGQAMPQFKQTAAKVVKVQ